jgi:thymidylate synthase
MQVYKELLQRILQNGVRKQNRTGIDTIGDIGAHMVFNLADGFPIVTLKKTYWKQSVAEMLCFLRGYTNAEDFRNMGCNVWDQNANENTDWLNNMNRKGEDDLGRVYGAQARDWTHLDKNGFIQIDQLKAVYEDLKEGIDNRREIVSHWNPGEMDNEYNYSYMALPPCHLLYQFGIQNGYLHLSMYQRSADLPLGVPFNIVGYAWLLSVMAHITGLKVGKFNHFLHDIHIYENQLDGVKAMLKHEPMKLPELWINPRIKSLNDLETWVTIDDFKIIGYESHDPIKMDMAV